MHGMKNILFTLSCLLFLSFSAASQFYKRGLPFITDYPPTQTGGSEQNWAVVQDRRGVMYFGNNDKGVLEYDGVRWRSIPVSNNSIVRSLAVDVNSTIYAGAVGEFGYLVPDENGRLEYASLSESLDSAASAFTDVWKTYTDNDLVYFCTEENTYICHLRTDSIQIIQNDPETFMSHLVGGVLYHSNITQGLLQQSGDSTVTMPGGDYFIQKYITCILPLPGGNFFVGTAGGGACIYDPGSGSIDTAFTDPAVNRFLKDNVLYQGILLGDGRLGISTLYGGFIIMDGQGRLIQKFNKESGLQDEQVLYAYVNPDLPDQSPLWFALNYGISKAEINSPIRMFGERSGLNGTINDLIRFNGKLYVATSSGIYYMEENPDGTIRFLKAEGLSTQCWAFTVFKPPGGGKSRLLVATITGLYEITGGNRARLLDTSILDKTSTRNYYMFTQMQSGRDPSLLYLAGESFVILRIDGDRITQVDEIDLQDDIRSLVEDDRGDIWLTTMRKGVTRIRFSGGDTLIDNYSVEDGLPSADRNYVYYPDNELYIATASGISRFDERTEHFYKDTVMGSVFNDAKAAVFRIMQDSRDRFWISYETESQYREVIVSREGDSVYADLLPFFRLPNKSTDVFYEDDEVVWFGKSTELYRFNDDYGKDYRLPYNTLVREVTVNMDSILFYGTDFSTAKDGRRLVSGSQNEQLKPSVKYAYNNLMITLSAPFFENEEATLYRYWLEGSNQGWSQWSDREEFVFSNLRPGQYRFHARARNVYGIESETGMYEFTILPPWYQTIYAYIAYVILFVVLIVVIVKLYTRRLVRENIKLEGIIQERTAEIRRQKEELTDSIEYASRIQQALLPSRSILKEELPEHFILFKPRDIVSGDFYWMSKQDGRIFMVAADCTGHGVPGAFMSMLGISYLNEVVSTLGISETNLILDKLRILVMESLKQTGEIEDETKDGMDLALMVIDKRSMKLQYSGAYNPMYFVRPLTRQERDILGKGGKIELPAGNLHNDRYMLEQLKADKMPIGISIKRSQPFNRHEIDLKPGYSLYIHSDGYVDQFGGPEGKKFMSKSFKKLLLDVQDMPMQAQGKLLDEKLREWQGEHAQVDDILVIGVRLEG